MQIYNYFRASLKNHSFEWDHDFNTQMKISVEIVYIIKSEIDETKPNFGWIERLSSRIRWKYVLNMVQIISQRNAVLTLNEYFFTKFVEKLSEDGAKMFFGQNKHFFENLIVKSNVEFSIRLENKFFFLDRTSVLPRL